MMTYKLVNLTPHNVTIFNAKGTKVIQTIGASGTVARCKVSTRIVGHVPGTSIPLTKSVFGEVENLPEPSEGTMYIVSRMVAEACPERGDLYVTNGSVRDEDNRIIGCTSLAQIR